MRSGWSVALMCGVVFGYSRFILGVSGGFLRYRCESWVRQWRLSQAPIVALLSDRNKHPRGDVYGGRIPVYRVAVVDAHAFSDVSVPSAPAYAVASSMWTFGLALVFRFYQLGHQTSHFAVRWYSALSSGVTTLFRTHSRTIHCRRCLGTGPTDLGGVSVYSFYR